MPKLSEIYGGNYLQADDIKDKGDVNVTIEKTSIMEQNDKKKVVLHFRNSDKTLPLNVTNANMIEELLGSDDTDDWEGQRICLYTCKVDFQGKRVLGIRVKAATSKNGKPAKAKPPVEDDDNTHDDELVSELDAEVQAAENNPRRQLKDGVPF